MAEGIAKEVFRTRFSERAGEVDISSAGIIAGDGNPATREAVLTAEAHGLDISGHRSRGLGGRLVASSDLVLTMDGSQTTIARSLSRTGVGHVFSLLRLAEVARGIKDEAPGGPRERLSRLLEAAEAAEPAEQWTPETARYDVPDPIGMPRSEYERAFDLMEPAIKEIIEFMGVTS